MADPLDELYSELGLGGRSRRKDPIDELYERLGLGATQQQRKPVQLQPSIEEQSLLRSLAGQGMSLLGWIGGSLDKLRRPVVGGLDMLTGGDTPASELASFIPFSDTLGLTSEDDSASFRDVMTNLGAPQNVKGFHPIGNPLDAALDAAGLAGDIAFDPSAYVLPGVSRAGSLLQKASALPKGAAKRASTNITDVVTALQRRAADVDDIGSRYAAEKLADIADASGKYVKGKGIDPIAELLADPIAKEASGGAIGLGLPWRDPAVILDELPFSGAAKSLYGATKEVPVLGRAVRAAETTLGKTGAAARRLVDYRLRDVEGRTSFETAEQLTKNMDANQRTVRDQIGTWSQARRDSNLTSLEHEDELYELIEGVKSKDYASNPLLANISKEIERDREFLLELQQRYGRPIEGLDDDGLGYAHRQIYKSDPGGEPPRAFRMGANKQSEIMRTVRGVPAGTAAIRRAARLISENPDLIGNEQAIAKFLADSPQLAVPPEVAGFFGKLDVEQLSRGGFSGDPMIRFGQYKVKALDSVAAIDKSLDLIAKTAWKSPSQTLAHGKRLPTIREVLSASHLTPRAFERLAEKMPDIAREEIGQMVVPKEIAANLARFVKGWVEPDAVKGLKETFDSMHALWKSSVLATPSRHVRDLVTGIWQNAVTGTFSKKAYGVMKQVLLGADAVPGVAKMLPKLGKTDKAVTDALRREMHANDILGHYKGTDILHLGPGGREDTIKEMLGEFAGDRPYDWRQIKDKLLLRHPDVTINPLDQRGVFGKRDTKFFLGSASDDAGYWTDSANRGAAYIKLRADGFGQEAATRQVREAHVDYRSKAFTAFEREKMTRLFPFYRFTRGMVPWTLRELYERPGGITAQSIKAAARSRDDTTPLPDRYSRTLNIPLGTSPDGTKRYLTNLGIGYEDPLQLGTIGPGALGTVSGTLSELLSRTNPLVKGAAELATQKLLFAGGQDIQDANPALGQAVSNIAQSFGYNEFDKDQFGIIPEYLSSATPYLGTAINKIRVGFDPRKGPIDKAINLLTGVKVSDISPAAQQRKAGDVIRESIRDLGGSIFETPYLTEEDAEQMPVDRASAIQELLSLDRNRKKRRLEELRRERAVAQ